MSGVDISREACERRRLRMESAAINFRARYGECCGQRDNDGVCAAPACIYGDVLRALDPTHILALRAALDAAERERDDLQASFSLRWKADMRAIKRWQEKHPKRDKVWPDHADLVVWLLEGWEECSVELLKCIHDRDAADATGYARGVRDAASVIECGCKNRNEVVMQRPNSAARWSLCEHPNCMAIEVAAILALLPAEKETTT